MRGYFAYHAIPTNYSAPQPTRWIDLGSCLRLGSPMGCHNLASRTLDHTSDLPSTIQGGSPVPESGPPGFVRGARSNMRPYHDISDVGDVKEYNACRCC